MSSDNSKIRDWQQAQERLTHEATRTLGGWLTGHIDRAEYDQRIDELALQAQVGTAIHTR